MKRRDTETPGQRRRRRDSERETGRWGDWEMWKRKARCHRRSNGGGGAGASHTFLT